MFGADIGVSADWLAVFVTAAAGLITSILARLASARLQRERSPVTLDDRIETLTKALKESTRIVGEVEKEIATRTQAVEKLRTEQELLELMPTTPRQM